MGEVIYVLYVISLAIPFHYGVLGLTVITGGQSCILAREVPREPQRLSVGVDEEEYVKAQTC